MIVGNDISSYQGNIDYSVYSKNSNFIIIKVSEGNGYIDPKFIRNQTEARIAGLPLGYYHFARPDLGNTPEAEADFFLKTIGKLLDGEMLCLDYEPKSNPGDAVAWCKGFLDRIFSVTGCRPLLYLNKSQVSGFNWKSVADAGYGLWLACYDENTIAGPWKFIAMQQWTSGQTVPGITTGVVDGDYFFGTVEQFKAYGYHKPVVSSPSPSSEPPSYDLIVIKLSQIIKSQWTWFGSKSWLNRLGQLRKILYENNV